MFLNAEIKRILMGKHHLNQAMVMSGLGRAHSKKTTKNEMKWIHLHAKAPGERERCILTVFMV